MLPFLARQLQTAARTAETLGGESFTLGGATYTGTLNETRAVAQANLTGIESIKMLEIVAEKSQFATKPDPTTRPALTARGASWTLTGGVGESELHYFLTAVPA